MTLFTPEMKRNIEEQLRRMNEEMARALEEAERGGDAYGPAGAAVARISRVIDMKLDAVTSFPGIEARPGVDIPFFALYDLFSDIDRLADLAATIAAVINAVTNREDVERARRQAIAELQNAIDELEVNLINKFNFADPEAARILREMRDALRNLKRELENLPPGEGSRWREVDELRRLIRSLKKAFLDRFESALPLWDVYSLLAEIDELLRWARHLIGKYLPPNSRQSRMGRRALQDAIDTKRRLERLVAQTPTKDVKSWSESLDPPGKPKQPAPKYLKGAGDLAPFDPGTPESVRRRRPASRDRARPTRPRSKAPARRPRARS